MRILPVPERRAWPFPGFRGIGAALGAELSLWSIVSAAPTGESCDSLLARDGAGRELTPHEKVAAVERAYRRHRGLVFRVGLRYGRGSHAWADDLTQEVFVDLLHAIDQLGELDALEGWLYRTATFRCLKRLRRERLMQSAPARWFLGSEGEGPVRPDAIAFARDDLERAFRALDELPPKERVAFCMYYLDGRPQHEIGEMMAHGKSYVCKLLHRAVERLRKQGWEVPSDDE